VIVQIGFTGPGRHEKLHLDSSPMLGDAGVISSASYWSVVPMVDLQILVYLSNVLILVTASDFIIGKMGRPEYGSWPQLVEIKNVIYVIPMRMCNSL
jgi:hypothetical protein